MADGVAGVFGIPGSHQAGSAASVQTTFQQPVGEAHSWKIPRNTTRELIREEAVQLTLDRRLAAMVPVATAVQLVN